jgi:periplasmic protein TonB
VPRTIPHGVTADDLNAPDLPSSLHACPNCTGANSNAALSSILNNSASATTVKPAPAQKPLKISHLDPGNLVHQVQPKYPMPAKISHVHGEVVLRAIIAKDGTIDSLRVISGHPLLTGAAIDAVKQWRYRPYMLNGQAIEVETQIIVNFTLGS